MTGRTPNRYALTKLLPGLKTANETSWLAEVTAQALQQELVHLESAYTNFLKRKWGHPKFKSKRDDRQSFGLPQRVWIKNKCIKLPKIGRVKANTSRTFNGSIKTCFVSRTPTDKYFVSILVEDGIDLPVSQPYSECSTIGVDLGIKCFATLSTGEKIDNPRHLSKRLKLLKREQRRLARKRKGSNNWNKQRHKLALVYETITNCGKDFKHKLSTRLVRENQALAFETLNIEGMLKNRCLSRQVSDVGWGGFMKLCRYKALWSGKTVLQIGRFEPSSRLCDCGWINRDMTLKDRSWTCGQCGLTHDRDIQAARNIKRMALHPRNSVRQDMPEFTLAEIGVS